MITVVGWRAGYSSKGAAQLAGAACCAPLVQLAVGAQRVHPPPQCAAHCSSSTTRAHAYLAASVSLQACKW